MSTAAKTYFLTLAERVVLGRILPRQGNDGSLKKIRKLKEMIELKAWEEPLYSVTWVDRLAGAYDWTDLKRKRWFKFPAATLEIIKTCLTSANRVDQLPDTLLDFFHELGLEVQEKEPEEIIEAEEPEDQVPEHLKNICLGYPAGQVTVQDNPDDAVGLDHEVMAGGQQRTLVGKDGEQ